MCTMLMMAVPGTVSLQVMRNSVPCATQLVIINIIIRSSSTQQLVPVRTGTTVHFSFCFLQSRRYF